MAKYLLTYNGGTSGENATEEEGKAIMAAWTTWLAQLGAAVADVGNPTGPVKTIAPNGGVTEGPGANPVMGYSLLSADSLDKAVEMAKGCPHLAAGGSVEVYETIDMM